MNAPDSVRTSFGFSYKSASDHIRALVKLWYHFLGATVGVLGALWLICEISAQCFDFVLRGWIVYTGIGILSLGAAAVWVWRRYLNMAPDGFNGESKSAQRIAQLQPVKWEFRLARELLQTKLGELDEQLEDVLCGRVHVPAERAMSLRAYAGWLALRPQNLLRMAGTAKRLLITDMPVALQSRRGSMADPVQILEVSNRVQSLYAETVAFERESHAVIPCKGFEQVHNLQLGWSAPIRDGIRQMLDFLERVVSIDPDEDHDLSFEIVFEVPEHMDEFFEAFEQATRLAETDLDTDDLLT